ASAPRAAGRPDVEEVRRVQDGDPDRRPALRPLHRTRGGVSARALQGAERRRRDAPQEQQEQDQRQPAVEEATTLGLASCETFGGRAMRIPIYQVDAFASRVFTGNPAAVCPLEAWLDDATLQGIAAENNLSETAYFVGGAGTYAIRWFTPGTEVDL